MEVLDRINQMRMTLESLLKTHDLNDKVVIEVSQKLDELIVEYYRQQNKDVNKSLEDNIQKTSIERVI